METDLRIIWTINLSEIAASVGFLIGMGIFIGHFKGFMKESQNDRANIWRRMNEMHNENQSYLKLILDKLMLPPKR